MHRDIQGKQVKISAADSATAFIPFPLPPDPPIEWTPQLRYGFDSALLALGRLDGISKQLPTFLFLYAYVRKEAVLSSMIEGTKSTLTDLMAFENGLEPGVPLSDVREVSNYVAALDHGMARLKEGFPMSLRLLREMHGRLMSDTRGGSCAPGEFRRIQNWIGGTKPAHASFIPPPVNELMPCLDNLERFLNDEASMTPPLVKAALAHVQFETIHPFLDGNGRLGRLLITLLLCHDGVLKEPLLYLSLYFKNHRRAYYGLLNEVRYKGRWEAWLAFFAEAVCVTATQAVETAQQLQALGTEDSNRIKSLGRAAASPLRLHEALMTRPVTTAAQLAQDTSLAPATVNKGLSNLEALGIVRELTGQKRNRLYSYTRYLDIMNSGIDE